MQAQIAPRFSARVGASVKACAVRKVPLARAASAPKRNGPMQPADFGHGNQNGGTNLRIWCGRNLSSAHCSQFVIGGLGDCLVASGQWLVVKQTERAVSTIVAKMQFGPKTQIGSYGNIVSRFHLFVAFCPIKAPFIQVYT